MRLFLPTASAGCVNDWLSSTTNTKAHNHTTADPTNLEFLQALRLQHPIKMKLTVIFFALFGQAMVMAMGMATAAVSPTPTTTFVVNAVLQTPTESADGMSLVQAMCGGRG
jgi:hypothetical protein